MCVVHEGVVNKKMYSQKIKDSPWRISAFVAFIAIALSLLMFSGDLGNAAGKTAQESTQKTVAQAVEDHAPPSLKTVKVPKVKDIDKFVEDKDAAIVLGKAFFWDMAAGSDGQACASCHFDSGADKRVKNQLTPGLLTQPNRDTTFQQTASGGQGGPNYTLIADDFPFHQFQDPDDRNSGVKFTTNDAASSQGTFAGNFTAVPPQNMLDDICDRFPDPIFHVNGIGVRKVEPRNTPTMINAVFNFRNFWDGRANNVFNGVDPFGLRNQNATVLKKDGCVVSGGDVLAS